MSTTPDYFQDHMPENVCFGCGNANHDGLQIKSFWEGDVSICHWMPEEKYHGWANLLNGGIMATLVDCHCMGTAMAYAYREEDRDLDSEPVYRYATGSLEIRYLKPTSNLHPVELRAEIQEAKGRKVVMSCQILSQGVVTAEAKAVAIRVFDSSTSSVENNPFV